MRLLSLSIYISARGSYSLSPPHIQIYAHKQSIEHIPPTAIPTSLPHNIKHTNLTVLHVLLHVHLWAMCPGDRPPKP